MGDLQIIHAAFYDDMREIILNARKNAVSSVEFTRVMMYGRLGERIFIEEQHSQDRAECCGTFLLWYGILNTEGGCWQNG